MNPRDPLAAGIAALELALPGDAFDKLIAYLVLLGKWNKVYNLTAVRDTERMVSHHLLDSLAAVPLFKTGRVLDVGSGGGLPGIPLAIARPDLHVTLIDTVAKKTAFLAQAKAELGLKNLVVITGRVENQRSETGFDTITSRAFSELALFIGLTRHLLAPGGRWLALKGVRPAEELAALPPDVRLLAEHALAVPGLDAERCAIELEPA